MTETKTIYQALLEAQKKIEPITKDATANAGSFKYNYATLGQVIEAVKKQLSDVGISIIQPIGGTGVVTKLIYIDGTEISDNGTPIICAKPNDPQAQGSAISYARRYGLMSLLCLSAEDDDGVKAMPHASPTKQTDDFLREPVNNLEVFCEVCKTKMIEKHGIKDGKEWTGYFCPKSTKETPHPPRWI